jgi:hypothetical protein
MKKSLSDHVISNVLSLSWSGLLVFALMPSAWSAKLALVEKAKLGSCEVSVAQDPKVSGRLHVTATVGPSHKLISVSITDGISLLSEDQSVKGGSCIYDPSKSTLHANVTVQTRYDARTKKDFETYILKCGGSSYKVDKTVEITVDGEGRIIEILDKTSTAQYEFGLFNRLQTKVDEPPLRCSNSPDANDRSAVELATYTLNRINPRAISSAPGVVTAQSKPRQPDASTQETVGNDGSQTNSGGIEQQVLDGWRNQK